MDAIVDAIRPGITAYEVYKAWQQTVNKAGLSHYRRRRFGYSVGIGFPPSWIGAGVPVGRRAGSRMELRSGMVFHVLSRLLRTGQGDSFLSNTVVVTDHGAEVLTKTTQDLAVR